MKKLIVFILIVLLLCGMNSNFAQGLNLKSLFKGANVEVYVVGEVDNDKYKILKNGDGAVIFTVIEELDYILSSYKVNGYTVAVGGDIGGVLTALSPEKTYINAWGVYGYKAGLGDGVLVNDNYCNFQIVEKMGIVLLGCPILLGSY